MYPVSDAYLVALRSPIKQLFLKIEMFDSSDVFIREVTKKVTKDDIGSISVSNDRAIRRSFSFSLKNEDNEFDFGTENLIWLDKRIKLYIGLKLKSGGIEYVPQGYFILTEPQDSHTLDGKKTTITGQDKAYLLTDDRGKFINNTTIATGANIATTIKLIASDIGETFYNFDTVTETVPYELTYDAGTSRWDAISELALLAKSEVYYDVDGYLRLRKIDLNEFESLPINWTFTYGDGTDKFYAGNVRKLEDTIRNHVIALGGSSQTATQRYEIIVTEDNVLWADSAYSVEKIGYRTYWHNNGNPDPLLGGSSSDPCKWRAKYELRNRLGYTERLTAYSAPIYSFDANDIIEITDSENSVSGRYLLQSFSLPINPTQMSLECLKYVKVLDDWDSF
jgi:hypothetical protein